SLYLPAIAAMTALSAAAIPQESLLQRQADASRLKPAVGLRQTHAHARKAAPSGKAASAEWSEWEMAGTGTLTLDSGFGDFLGMPEWTGDFPDINVYSRTDAADPSAMQYKFEGVFNNVDLVVDYDSESGLCKVLPQPTEIEYGGEVLYVADFASINEIYAEEWVGMSPEEIEPVVEYYSQFNYFVPDLGRFYLFLGYFVEGYDDVINLTDTTFQLDGVEDMSVSVETQAFYKDSSDMKGLVKFGPGVPVCRYGCFSGILTQDKLNAVIEGAEGVMTLTETSEIDLIASDGNGMYSVVAVTFSADGTPLEWDYAEYTFTSSSNEGWTLLGKGSYTSDLVESLFGDDVATYEVDVECNDSDPALIRIVNPYGPASPYYDDEYADCVKDFDIYIVFDTTDPDRVFFKPTNIGIDFGGGWWIATSAGYYMENVAGADTTPQMFGSLYDGKLSFPVGSVFVTCENVDVFGGKPGMWYFGNASGDLSLTIPTSTAADSMDAVADDDPEYFNMQGLRIDRPVKGSIVIERRGSVISKRMIR
ncbi:MAG: hypothetical protein K2I92_00830, partial [Muribaculaceae bacterium]|nr:hypothetical protein [Muribaculaceae bacterium]